MKKYLKKIFFNRFFQGGMVLTSTNLILGFLNYLFNSLSGKLLGPAKYSEISALFSYLIIFGIPSSVITTEIIRKLGNAGMERFRLVKSWNEWYGKIIRKWRILVIFFLLFFVFVIPPLTNLSLIYSLTLITLVLMSFLSVFYTSAMLGLHLFFLYALATIISTLVKLLGPVLVYTGINGTTVIAVFINFSSVVLVFISYLGINRLLKKVKNKYSSEKKLTRVLFNRQMMILTLTALSIMLINNLDVIFVKKFYSAEMAGIYGAWNLFSKMIFYLLSPLMSMTYIFFTSKEVENKHLLVFVVNTVLLLGLGFVLYFFYLFGGEFLLAVIFNEKYAAILPILPKAAIFGMLFVAINFFNGYFVAKKSLVSLAALPYIPFYALGLIFFGRNIGSVVKINLLFSGLIALTYLLFFILRLYSDSKSAKRLFTV